MRDFYVRATPPLVERNERLRADILREARRNGWTGETLPPFEADPSKEGAPLRFYDGEAGIVGNAAQG
ncbi:MAG: hypothetical protein KIS96_14555 [Bauldia sp.]|nr:hypothetical protein [Bauldia sp.]